MNIYYLRVLGSSLIFETQVKAKGIAWSESGLYEFWTINENGLREGVAYYPVDRTVVESIEYGVEQ